MAKEGFGNIVLKVVKGPFDYFPYTMGITKNGKREVYGLTGSLFANITAALNISYDLLDSVDEYWGNLLDDGNFTGPLGMLQRNEADVAVGPFSLKVDYLRYVYAAEAHIYEDVPILSGMERPFLPGAFSSTDSFPPKTMVLLFATMVILVLLTACALHNGRSRWTTTLQPIFWAYAESLLLKSVTQGPIVSSKSTRRFLPVQDGEVKAALLIRSPVDRIDTLEDMLARRPTIRPVTLKATPLINMLQLSGLDTYRALHGRILTMNGELPQTEVYSMRTLRQVVAGETVIIMDATGNRVFIAPHCDTLQPAYFHVSRQRIETADFRWYMNKRLDHRLVAAMDRSYELLDTVDTQWGNLLDDGNFTGALGMLQRNEADVAVGPFSLKVDYLRYLYAAEAHVYVDVPILSALRRPYLPGAFSSTDSFEPRVKAALLIRSPAPRIDTLEQMLARRPPIRPVTLTSTPLMNMLRLSGLDSYRALHDRILRMRSEVPITEIYSIRNLRQVVAGDAIIIMDTTGNRVYVAPHCEALQPAYFHMSQQRLETADFRWYMNKRLDPKLVTAMDRRIRWLLEGNVPFMHHHEIYRKPATCFLDQLAAGGSGAVAGSYEVLHLEDVQAAFLVLLCSLAFSMTVFLGESLFHFTQRSWEEKQNGVASGMYFG
ncbi:hypothetical protein HPB50_025914 [Hyalomma asiaticum]|uniref:Uncharacterized protein n=1 Tax=Hyalomma asiaticum TaxID=266040 RepID=A0ACB7RSR7_HYAAI|nr:hypothetical protein HPB50_025914 [Hyalomma asiaticum]